MKIFKSIGYRIAFGAIALLFAACNSTQTADKDPKQEDEQTEVTTTTSHQATSEMSDYLVVDFNATWCQPCQIFAPTFEKVAEEFAGLADFESIDIDEEPDLAEAFQITSIPCVIILKGDEIVARHSGLMSYDKFKNFVESALK